MTSSTPAPQRFTTRIWSYLKVWLGLHTVHPREWAGLSLKNWWAMLAEGRKALASLTLLVSWEIWNKRNARVFNNKHAPPLVVLDKIKKEARLWILAGAKHLGDVILGE